MSGIRGCFCATHPPSFIQINTPFAPKSRPEVDRVDKVASHNVGEHVGGPVDGCGRHVGIAGTGDLGALSTLIATEDTRGIEWRLMPLHSYIALEQVRKNRL